MIANGGSMKCGGRCENVCLQIDQYHMKSHMFVIDMGGCDIVLGVEWLRNLGPILMDFKEIPSLRYSILALMETYTIYFS